MEKVYVHIKNGFPINEDIQKAIDGFEYLGYEAIPITMEKMLAGDLDNLAKIYPVVGSIDFMTMLFKRLGKLPEPIDFPEDILQFLNRTILRVNLRFIFSGKYTDVFIKPIQTKLFDGIFISEESQLSYLKDYPLSTEIWMSEKIDITSEHRIYVHNGEMVYGCCYSGDFKISPDYFYVAKLIASYGNAPKAYTIDVAVLKDGKNTVVEFNDFWAIGGYGIAPWDYAEMLKDRYFEIIK